MPVGSSVTVKLGTSISLLQLLSSSLVGKESWRLKVNGPRFAAERVPASSAPQSSRALPPRKRCSRWSRCHKDTRSTMCIDLRRNRCQGRSHYLHPLMEATVTRITQDGKEKNSYSKNVSRSSSSLSSGGVLR